METILSLQLLPVVGTELSCADSRVSCNSDLSCRSGTSCASLVSDFKDEPVRPSDPA